MVALPMGSHCPIRLSTERKQHRTVRITQRHGARACQSEVVRPTYDSAPLQQVIWARAGLSRKHRAFPGAARVGWLLSRTPGGTTWASHSRGRLGATTAGNSVLSKTCCHIAHLGIRHIRARRPILSSVTVQTQNVSATLYGWERLREWRISVTAAPPSSDARRNRSRPPSDSNGW